MGCKGPPSLNVLNVAHGVTQVSLGVLPAGHAAPLYGSKHSTGSERVAGEPG